MSECIFQINFFKKFIILKSSTSIHTGMIIPVLELVISHDGIGIQTGTVKFSKYRKLHNNLNFKSIVNLKMSKWTANCEAQLALDKLFETKDPIIYMGAAHVYESSQYSNLFKKYSKNVFGTHFSNSNKAFSIINSNSIIYNKIRF